MKNKISSYQKLKQDRDNLYRLYSRARKRLFELGEGVEDDDLIMDFDTDFIPEVSEKNKKIFIERIESPIVSNNKVAIK